MLLKKVVIGPVQLTRAKVFNIYVYEKMEFIPIHTMNQN